MDVHRPGPKNSCMTPHCPTRLFYLVAILAALQNGQATANVPPQKFFPLDRTHSQPKRPQAEAKFIPFKRQNGRPLIFVPQSRQPLPLNSPPNTQPQPPAGDKASSQPLTNNQANGLLSIYESVE